ncbi:DUF6221 family protein [Streptomyces sp. NPDC057579]|uniref:DUF6221 family protein n=1 Tax=Streptomyces sp. NPDC057579 TaxID=3346172 RepID=UPI0036CC7923
MDDLVWFLYARLDDDARAARSALGREWLFGAGWLIAEGPPGGSERPREVCEIADEPTGRYIARQNPARVLRGGAALKRIVDEYAETARRRDTAVGRIKERGERASQEDLDAWDRSQYQAGILEGPLRLLALTYADHPDYRDTWRP